MLLYLHASFVNKWECSAYLKMSKYSGLLIAGKHMTLIQLEWLASLGSSLGWMCVNEYTMHMPAHTLACAHTLCTHTMHTGLITLANVIHSLMNVLHTPDMEPISVRNKAEYLSTAAGCSFEESKMCLAWSWMILHKDQNFWKTCFPVRSTYTYPGRGGQY